MKSGPTVKVSQEGVSVIQAKDNGRRRDAEKRNDSGSSLGGDGREVGREEERKERRALESGLG